MKKIYSELARIQHELNAPKTLFNKFGNYYYRNAEGILAAVKPLLKDMALIINDEPVLVGDRFYIKATATLTDGEESVSAVAYAREDETKKGMDGCQLTGACSSYARKYALNALLMIDDAKDSDDESLSPKNPKNEPEKPVRQEIPAKPVKQDAPAMVETVKKIPPANPVQAYINNEIAFMSQRLEISDKKAMMEKFAEMRNELIKGGVIVDVKSDAMTMEQAKQMIDAMYNTFFTDGGQKWSAS